MKYVIIIILLNAISLVSAGQNVRPLIVGEQTDLHSKYNRSYEISVFLPENYSKDSTKYSCLYLFYGEDRKFLIASGIATALSNATWEIPKLIIVGVTNMQWSRDLTPIPIKGMEDKSGGGKDFLSFVTNDLFKFIDNRYKTNNHRIFMGHSFGGLFGVYSFLENPESFNDYILISPSIATRADYIQDAFKQKILNSNDELNNKIYFSLGTEESRLQKSSLWLLEGLESKKLKNLKWKYEVHPGKNHHTVVPVSLMNGLLYVFAKENK
ncbi:MAG: alpha/beta hydrolase [Sphingobacteriaceae bacterium]